MTRDRAGGAAALLVGAGLIGLGVWAWRRFFTGAPAASAPDTALATQFAAQQPAAFAPAPNPALKWPFSASTLQAPPQTGVPVPGEAFSSRTAAPMAANVISLVPGEQEAKIAAELASTSFFQEVKAPTTTAEEQRLMELKKAYAAERAGQCGA